MYKTSDYTYYPIREYLQAGAGGDLEGLCSEVLVLWSEPRVLLNTPRYRLAYLHLLCDPHSPTQDLTLHAVLWEPGSLWKVVIIDCSEVCNPDFWQEETAFAAQMQLTMASFSCEYPLYSRRPARAQPLTLDHLLLERPVDTAQRPARHTSTKPDWVLRNQTSAVGKPGGCQTRK